MARAKSKLNKDFTKEELVKAFVKCHGLCQLVADHLGVHVSHIYRERDRLGMGEEVKRIRKMARESWGDEAEHSLLKIIRLTDSRPDVALKGVQYFLDKQCRDRGYGDGAPDSSDAREAFRSFNLTISN